MRNFRFVLTSLALAGGLTACTDELTVVNENQADAARALARPADVEGLIANSFNTQHATTIGASSLNPQMFVFGMENYSNLANFGSATRAAIPRPPINNSINNPTAGENAGPYAGLHRAARAAAMGLNRVKTPGFIFFPPNAAQNARARAFANFVMGISLGQLAMAYDSSIMIHEADPPNVLAAPLPLVDYVAQMQYALDRLDTAIVDAGLMTGQTIPATWMATSAAVTQAQFIALIRGWKARLRSAVARTPADVAGINWTAVRDDALAFLAQWGGAVPGAAADVGFVQNLNTTLGWGFGWLPTVYQSNSQNWHQAWGYMVYMAAGQADYDAWLGTAPALRAAFPIVTPDRRWPNGGAFCPGANCRLAQQCASGSVTGASCTPVGSPTSGPFQYWENRTSDWFGDPSANTQYRGQRFRALALASNTVGAYPSMNAAEMRLTAAEAYYQLADYANAATYVNHTRVARGVLPAAPPDATTLVGGGAACVPRIPVGPSYTSSACGNLLEALKWEKRMETAYSRWGGWYFDGRRWGDLPEGTAIHWPVPYQELLTRQYTSFHQTGGSGSTALPRGNYGL